METNCANRVDVAVMNKVDTSLGHIQDELSDVGMAVLDMPSLVGPVRAELLRFFATNEFGDMGPALAEFGTDAGMSPAPLARSLTIFGVRQVVERLQQALKRLEEHEDAKLSAWGKARFGDEIDIDFRGLAIRPKSAISKDRLGALRLSRQLVDASPDMRRRVATSTAPNLGGLGQFAVDLACAMLAEVRLASLVTGLWNLRTAAEIDSVVEGAALEGSPHQAPIVFLAELLKDLSKLPEAERASVSARILNQAA